MVQLFPYNYYCEIMKLTEFRKDFERIVMLWPLRVDQCIDVINNLNNATFILRKIKVELSLRTSNHYHDYYTKLLIELNIHAMEGMDILTYRYMGIHCIIYTIW